MVSGVAAIVLGTRPELIKLLGIIDELGADAAVVHTGQHFSAELAAGLFGPERTVEPTAQLAIGGAHRGVQIGAATSALTEWLLANRPACVVVQGDTNSALAGGLAANALELPLVHVEAGLRSFDRAMPEEHNRVLIDHLADACCAPTETSRANLAAEGISGDRVTVTGNTVIEALARLLPPPERRAEIRARLATPAGEPFALATLHRPENVDDEARLARTVAALGECQVPVVFAVHPRTAANLERWGIALPPNVRGGPPITYPEFLALAAESAVLVSDSGGIQEEASVLKRPVAVLRRSTERPEVLGTFAELVTEPDGLADVVRGWLEDLPSTHQRLAAIPSPYGCGDASTTIAALIRDRFA